MHGTRPEPSAPSSAAYWPAGIPHQAANYRAPCVVGGAQFGTRLMLALCDLDGLDSHYPLQGDEPCVERLRGRKVARNQRRNDLGLCSQSLSYSHIASQSGWLLRATRNTLTTSSNWQSASLPKWKQ